ncbi:hypothetical protein V5O48_006643 [Marasmius crinis-equi]|uniref:Uncharacterized protein n=1 Tax=Marasmius crinis-equi TaxID=585013 RepID=A0ABR3FIZ0_9AGAR
MSSPVNRKRGLDLFVGNGNPIFINSGALESGRLLTSLPTPSTVWKDKLIEVYALKAPDQAFGKWITLARTIRIHQLWGPSSLYCIGEGFMTKPTRRTSLLCIARSIRNNLPSRYSFWMPTPALSFNIRSDHENDLVVTLGLNGRQTQSVEDKPEDDSVVNCDPYRSNCYLTIGFANLGGQGEEEQVAVECNSATDTRPGAPCGGAGSG